MNSKVSIITCKNYDEDNVNKAVKQALNLIGGLKSIIKPGQRVLLKVNLLASTEPEKAVTTHPSIVKAVAKEIIKIGAIPFIADSPGFLFVAGGKNKALVKSGIGDIASDIGIEAMQFESVENPFVEKRVKEAKYLKTMHIARLFLEADMIISLPKLKTHGLTYYTGAVKNLFGVVAPNTRRTAHKIGDYKEFAETVVDIYSVKKPVLALMDGVIGMEGAGPRHGNPRYAGLILASYDCVSLDAIAQKIIGFKPDEIFTTVLAAQRGLGEANLSKIKVLGEEIDNVLVDFKKPFVRKRVPTLVLDIVDKWLKIQPQVNEKKCNNCKICVKSCPVDGIEMKNYPAIDKDKCIECFCCNEMCPEGAMEIKKNWLARWLS